MVLLLNEARRDGDTALGLLAQGWDGFMAQREQALIAQSWLNRDPDDKTDLPSIPQDRIPEYGELRDSSPTPWLLLPTTVLTQNLYVEGHYPAGSKANQISKVMEALWQPNSCDALQVPLHFAAVGHGISYGRSYMGQKTFSRDKLVRMRGISALRGCAFWREGEFSEYPEFFIEGYKQNTEDEGDVWILQIIDGTKVHHVRYSPEFDGDGFDVERAVYVDSEPHGANVTPIVQFSNRGDLDGNIVGEVEPFIPLAKRIDQDTFDRLIVQRFGSWKIRTIAGLEMPKDASEKARVAQILRVNDLLVSDNDKTKFGTLDGTPLDGYIAARDADVRDLAAVSQTPPHHLLGLSPNVSAEGLVEAQSNLMRKVTQRQHAFGESWERWLRLGAHMMDLHEEAEDYTSRVRWRDTEVRSLQQIADALGKLATMVEVPVEMLWREIPNWNGMDIEQARELREQAMLEERQMAMFEAGLSTAGSAGQPEGGGARDTLTDAEQRRLNRMRGGHGPDWDGDGKPN